TSTTSTCFWNLPSSGMAVPTAFTIACARSGLIAARRARVLSGRVTVIGRRDSLNFGGRPLGGFLICADIVRYKAGIDRFLTLKRVIFDSIQRFRNGQDYIEEAGSNAAVVFCFCEISNLATSEGCGPA